MPASRDAATKADSAPTVGREPGWSPTRRLITAFVAVALLALTAGIARPASTEPILTDTGTPMAGSVAELIRVPIGGHDQAMMIRGASTKNPVLLFLAGGPGGTELGAMRRHEPILTNDAQVYPYDHSHNSEGAGGFSENLFVSEYTLMEQLHAFAGFFDVFTVLYPQLQDVDFREDVTHLALPIYLVEGRFEAPGRLGPAKQWFDLLDAPAKQLIIFDTSGHRPLFEQPDLFYELMTDTVLAQT